MCVQHAIPTRCTNIRMHTHTQRAVCAACVQRVCSMCAACVQHVNSMCVQHVCVQRACSRQHLYPANMPLRPHVRSACLSMCVQHAIPTRCTLIRHTQNVCSVCAACVQRVCSMCTAWVQHGCNKRCSHKRPHVRSVCFAQNVPRMHVRSMCAASQHGCSMCTAWVQHGCAAWVQQAAFIPRE